MSKKIYIVFAIICALTFATNAFASLTFTTNAITGTAASTIDVGAGNALSLQTTNNGNVIIGSGYLGVGTATPGSPLNVTGVTSTVTALTDLIAATLYPTSRFNGSFTDATAVTNQVTQLVAMDVNPNANWTSKSAYGQIVQVVVPSSNTAALTSSFLTGSLIQMRHNGSGVLDNQTGLQVTVNGGTGTVTTGIGASISYRATAGTSTSVTGVKGLSGIFSAGSATTAVSVDAAMSLTGTGSVGTLYGSRVNNLTNTATGGVTGVTYGYYVGDITTGTQTGGAYAFYNSDASAPSYLAAALGIGATTATTNSKLDVKDGHYASTQTTTPTVGVTGTGYSGASIVAGSTDTKGGITATVGAAAGTLVVTFNSVYASAPTCTVTPATATAQVDQVKMYATTSTTALTLNFVATPTGGSETFSYICLQ